MSDELPEGWSAAPVRSVFECWGGMTPSTAVNAYWDGGTIPWVSSRDVKFRTVDGATERITEKALADTRLRECPVGAVLVVVRSGVLAHTLPVALTTVPVVINQDVKALTCRTTELNEWLAVYLRAHQQEILEENRKEGTTVQSIRVEQLLDRQLPVAPLPEQRRIATQVEALLEQVDRAKGRLDRVPLILKRFRQAVLAAACSGELTKEWREERTDDATLLLSTLGVAAVPTEEEPNAEVPPTWRWIATEDLCERSRAITYGVIKLGDPVEGGVPTLRSSDVRPLYIDEAGVKRIAPEIASQYARTFLRGGEVLVTVRGTLGGIAVVPPHMAGFNISREVAQLPVRREVNADFVAFAVAAITSQNWLAERAKGVAYTGINIEDLRRLPLPMPHPREQAEVVKVVRRLFALADTIERRVQAATARADKLPQAILSKAFSGELVPTEAELARAEGRTYETAEEMLRRVAVEASAAGATKGSTRVGRKARERR